MSKVTTKLQLTVPKAIADQYGIRPGDELQWSPAGESIRIDLGHRIKSGQLLSRRERIELFDRGSERLRKLQGKHWRQAARRKERGQDRGWTREELYHRGFPR